MTGDRATANAPAATTLAELVQSAADLNPAGRLVGLNRSSTWVEVERRTASLAGTLTSCGVRPGDRVAVLRRKDGESLEAVHGILRSGAAYVPIDPLAPAELARQALADADVCAVVGDAGTIDALEPWSAVEHELAAVVSTGVPSKAPETVIDWDRAVAAPRRELPIVDPDEVAYLIYTSGSTGRPKGIVHTHRSALEYARRAVDEYGLERRDRVAGMNPLHFDMSTLELFAAPLAGASVVVMSEADLQFPAGLTKRTHDHAVTVWYGVPFLLRGVVERGGLDRRPLPSLREVLYGGEPYPASHLARLMTLLPGVPVVNVYGPAEVNACTHHRITDPSELRDDVPIGRPWNGADVRIVGDDGTDQPDGRPGELWVSTPTVMRGYWRLDDLTAARMHPAPGRPAWYATGDIVVRDADGVLWFRGRRDHQVKVRGVRLELESVEAVLSGAPGVVHAVAGTIGPAGDAAYIAAVVVGRPGVELDLAELRRWCAGRLPSVAVPRRIDVVQRFPTTGSGKIDRASVRAGLRTLADGAFRGPTDTVGRAD